LSGLAVVVARKTIIVWDKSRYLIGLLRLMLTKKAGKREEEEKKEKNGKRE
jgi:chemotaxis receptor (MCP) glutamine deamidase CheD